MDARPDWANEKAAYLCRGFPLREIRFEQEAAIASALRQAHAKGRAEAFQDAARIVEQDTVIGLDIVREGLVLRLRAKAEEAV